MKRIHHEIKRFRLDHPNIPISENEVNTNRTVHLVLRGSPKSHFDGRLIELRVTFPPNYPFSPPMIVVVGRPFFHPNINYLNNIVNMTEVMKIGWSPVFSLTTIVNHFISILHEPQECHGPDTRINLFRGGVSPNPSFGIVVPNQEGNDNNAEYHAEKETQIDCVNPAALEVWNDAKTYADFCT